MSVLNEIAAELEVAIALENESDFPTTDERVAALMLKENVSRDNAEAMIEIEDFYGNGDDSDFDDEFNEEGIEDFLNPLSRKWERLAAPMTWEKTFNAS